MSHTQRSRPRALWPLLAPLLLVAACGGGSGASPASTSAPAGSTTSAAVPTTATTTSAPATTPPPTPTTAAETPAIADPAAALAEGLRVWRQQRIDINGVDKGACANCHSADGIELAIWDFTGDDVVRRAHLDGVPPADEQVLMSYFKALRQKYAITTVRSVATDHPFQPGGSWYTGSVNERDLAFAGQSLARVFPTLMGAPIDTLAAAQQAVREVRASNPLDLKIGIELPQISRDCVRGGDECSLNDWMSDLPRFPRPEMQAQWFALNDAYIADPTDLNLRQLLLAVDTMTTPWLQPGETAMGPAGELGTTKFKSMQILQHFLRRQQLGLFKPSDDVNPIAAINGPGIERANFPFLVGDIAFNKIPQQLTQAAQLPVFVRQSLGETAGSPLTNAGVELQKQQMRTPWWWAGFMFDPALGTGTGGEYFIGNLSNPDDGEGYAFHQFYAASRSAVDAEYRATKGWDTSPTRLPHPIAIGGAGDSALLFATADARLMYRKTAVNWVRMHLLLLQDQLRQFGPAALSPDEASDSGFVCQQDPSQGLPANVLTAASFDGGSAAFLFAAYNEIRTLAGCPTLLRPAGYQAGGGTGLNVEWFASFDMTQRTTGTALGAHVEPVLQLSRQEFARGYFRDGLAGIGAVGNAGSRSTGFIQAPVSGAYVFGEGSLAQGRLWVDGQLVYDSTQPTQSSNGYNVNSGITVSLVAGRKVQIRLERYNVADNGISLGWALQDGTLPMHAIPTSQLWPQ